MGKSKTLNRRKLMLGLTGGILGTSQLPNYWTKPLINSVTLPTHAQTSVTITNFRSNMEVARNNDSILDGINDVFISRAYAGVIEQIEPADLSISVSGNVFSAKLLLDLVEDPKPFYTGTGTIGGGPFDFADENSCFEAGTIEVSSISDAGAVFNYSVETSNFSDRGILPPNPGSPINPGPRCGS